MVAMPPRVAAVRRPSVIVSLIATIGFLVVNGRIAGGRQDFFYLADAFLHGRTWLTFQIGQHDVIPLDGRFYVPFAPFPAFFDLPLVAAVGPDVAAAFAQLIDAAIAGLSVGAMWLVLARVGVRRAIDRAWLALLFAITTPLLWVTIRGSVWQEGQVLATGLTMLALIELTGRRRALAVGLVAGAAFLTRAPLAMAIPVYGLMLVPDDTWRTIRRPGMAIVERIRSLPWRVWFLLCLGAAPALVAFAWYNLVRFGDPLQTGYGLAVIADFLERRRELGLFSLAQVPQNLDYLLFHLPKVTGQFPFLTPDGFGMSLFITSPGLLLAFRADWNSRPVLLLGLATVATLIPSLLYYGGGWQQFGFRYFLDSAPFLVVVCGYAVARRHGIGFGWKLLIAASVLVNVVSVYWATRL